VVAKRGATDGPGYERRGAASGGQARSDRRGVAGTARSYQRGQASPRRGVAGAARRVRGSRSGGSESSLPFSSLARTTTQGSREAGTIELLPSALRLPPLRRILGAAKQGGWSCSLSPPCLLPRHRIQSKRGRRSLVQPSSSSQWARTGWLVVAWGTATGLELPAKGAGVKGGAAVAAWSQADRWKGKLQLLICCWRHPFEKERQSNVYARQR
jgi:hypothetical protein